MKNTGTIYVNKGAEYTDVDIYEAVCSEFNIELSELQKYNWSRQAKYCRPRQIIMQLLQDKAGFSQTAAGFVFRKDHSTALHSKRTVIRDLRNKQYKQVYSGIITRLVEKKICGQLSK